MTSRTIRARRLYQIRMALRVLHLPAKDWQGMAELADNLEHSLNPRRAAIARATVKEN